jgi:hypothetical protein
LIRTQSIRTKSANTDIGPMSGLLMVECPSCRVDTRSTLLPGSPKTPR